VATGRLFRSAEDFFVAASQAFVVGVQAALRPGPAAIHFMETVKTLAKNGEMNSEDPLEDHKSSDVEKRIGLRTAPNPGVQPPSGTRQARWPRLESR